MSKGKLVPKLRFEEFNKSEEWEEYNLEELAEVNNGRDYKHLEKGNVPVYGTGGYMTSVNAALSYKKDAIGIGRKGTIDRPYILRAPYWTVDTLFYVIPKVESSISFLHGTFKNINWLSKQESTGVPSLSKTTINKINILIPSILEQEKIGTFFKKVDQMISLQQSKLSKVKDIKSAYLSEMFPKEGEKYPKKRFEGFNEPWNLISFSDIAEVERGLTYHPSNIVESGGVRVLRSSNIDDDTFVIKDDDVFVSKDAINISFAEKQDILITSANGSPRLVGKHAILNTLDTESVHGGFMLLAKTDKPYFLNASMSSDWYGKFINYHVSGGGGSIGNIKKSDLEKQLIYVPLEEEQEKIGQFFRNLDNQISNEEEKLAKLEKLKQAYLKDMFV